MKDSITAQEIILLLEGMKSGTKANVAFEALDPKLTEEMLCYYRIRIKSSLRPGLNPYLVAAEIIREETPSTAGALALFWIASYLLGGNNALSHFAKLIKLKDGEVQKGS